jgi:ABC-type lipoprotein release transport system permease subunit
MAANLPGGASPVRSLLAGWRVSLQRTRADWPIVAAVWLITLLAAVLLSAGAIYPSAAAEAGLRRALADAPAADANIEISLYGPSSGAAALDGPAQKELRDVIAPIGGQIVRDWRSTATLGLPGLAAGEAGDQAILGFLDGLADHATLRAGEWPAERSGPSEPIQVVLVDTAATELRLGVGDELTFVAHAGSEPVVVAARLVGIFAINSITDAYWFGDELLTAGIHENPSYRTFGPFLTTLDDLLLHAGVDSVQMQWRAFPNFERQTVDEAAQLRRRVEALGERLQTATGEDFQVSTGLVAILSAAERSLLVSRAGVTLVMAQLAILAAYAVILTATLLADHRRVDTALLRSRGAGSRQVALLALAEGLSFTIPSVIIAPWLAAAALRVLNVAGPLADVRLRIDPQITLGSYLGAGAAGIACLVLLVLPAVLAARGFVAEQGGLSRQETRTFGQRVGLDIALVAVTAIALWQLRLYGAPLTRTVQGSLGLDPLLVAAPGIGLVAGGVLALRILPHLAAAVETAVARRGDLVVSLSSRQLARRPLRYTRSALLLMLAMSMGVFALSYATTWSTSQRDQAAYQAGAEVRVRPGRLIDAPPAWTLPGAYARLAGVEQLSPVERISDGISFTAAGSADLLALDADTAASVVLVRGDESATSLGALMEALRTGRREPRLIPAPAGATHLRVVPRVDIASTLTFDDETGEARSSPVPPGSLVGVSVSATAIVRDAHGLLYRVESSLVPMTWPATPILVPLEPIADGGAGVVGPARAHLDGPVELAALGIAVWLPDDMATSDAVFGVAALSAGAGPDGPWADVPLASADGWAARMGREFDVLEDVPAGQVQGSAVELNGDGPFGIVFDTGGHGPAVQISLLPASAAVTSGTIEAIANRSFLADTASTTGETVIAMIDGRARAFRIAGVVESFPTTDPGQPLLILDERTLGLARLQGTGSTRSPDEWWMAGADPDLQAITDSLRGSAFASAEVVAVVERTRSLGTDPVALGIIGALALGFVATGLFAIVGLTVSAGVSARQRRTEFALLRSLGLSGRQLSGSLWLENGSLVLVSLVAGTSLGLLIAWLVLPFVTVTQRAVAPIPPVVVHVPWDSIVVLLIASALALGLALVVIGGVLRRLGVGSILRMGED